MHCGITHRFAAVRLLAVAAIWLGGSGSLLAQTYTTLFLFGGGGSPRGTLVEGRDGNLYGTTYGYGGRTNGIIFKITPSGTFTALHSGGGTFQAGLTLGTDGNFYGTSIAGGTSGEGYVFKITPSGTLTALYSFGPPPNGGRLAEKLVQASDGNFYGTTLQGGTNGGGMVFRITPSGAETTIYNFCAQSGCTDGTAPLGLIQGTDGNLYGVTGGGGTAGGYGTIFKMTTAGTLTTLHSFDSTDGAGPEGLVQASDGNFYGTTNSGGFSNSNCNGGNVQGTCGTVFKMAPTGALTTLHLFNSTDGGNPGAAPIQASDGNIYGTTSAGGTNGAGTIYKITSTGTLTTVYNLNPSNGDGAFPVGLVQHTNGTFYGPTIRGGKIVYHFCPAWCGTLFSLSVP
jgi:uncharacterized repeat protein (TIGR03803 family)